MGFDEDLMNVPFEELDPCCQKEVLDRKKKNQISSKLRTIDRSFLKSDLRNEVMQKINSHSGCICCNKNQDYPLLQNLKDAIGINNSANETISQNDHLDSEGNEVKELEDDDDEFDIDLDFISPDQQARLNEMKRVAEERELALSLGFGKHLLDSVDHIKSDINFGFDIIVHFYNPSRIKCAKLDYELEIIAQTYLSTKFRRIQYNDPFVSLLQSIDPLIIPKVDGSIFCFKDHKLVGLVDNFQQLGYGDDIYPDELIKCLKNMNMLSFEPNIIDTIQKAIIKNSLSKKLSNDEPDESEMESFCDDPNCTKRYPHEHIRSNVNFADDFAIDPKNDHLASFMKKSHSGDEALAKNTFLRV